MAAGRRAEDYITCVMAGPCSRYTFTPVLSLEGKGVE